uniref:Uncharacterized protein n=1 Tax=Aegilops tauschii subsp. strangulata TaxID=200361 RepID=A0A453HE23_AEGTS
SRAMSETEGKKALTTLIIYSSNNTIGDRNDKLTQVSLVSLMLSFYVLASSSQPVLCLVRCMCSFMVILIKWLHFFFLNLCSEFEFADACLDCLYKCVSRKIPWATTWDR